MAAVERDVAEEARLVPAPGEHGEGDGDGHVHAHLADLDLALELARRRAALREDRRAVSVLVFVDDRERVVERVCLDHDEDGPEDLLAERFD